MTRQAVTADPASLSLGIAEFPHDDDPVLTRIVHYTSSGVVPVVLSLDASLSVAGQPAGPGMIAVSPPAITVPAGGSADAVVTVATRGARPDGVYGGALTATGDGVRIVTPVGVDREVASANLTIRIVGRDGQPAPLADVTVDGVGDPGDPAIDVHRFPTVTGPVTLRVPLGTYTVTTHDFTDDPALMIAPRFSLSADTSLVVDGRLARPLDVTLPERDLVVDRILWDFEDIRMDAGLAVLAASRLAEGEFGPSAAPGEIQSLVNATLLPPGDGPPARVYTLARRQPDHVLVGWQQTIRRGELATVEASHAAAEGQQFLKVVTPLSTTPPAFFVANGSLYPGPFRRTEFYFGDGFVWDVELQRQVPFPAVPGATITAEQLDQVRDYRPGQTYVERWNQAPLGPVFADDTLFGQLFGRGAATRDGDTLLLMPSMFSDQASPARGSASQVAHQHLTLSRDGQVIASRDDTAGQELLFIAVPPGPALYRLEQDTARPADQFPLSTHVTAAWTFHSQHTDGTVALPVPMLRFLPELDDHNRTAAGALILPVRIERPAGADAPRIAQLRVDASFDDGATWSPVPTLVLGDRALGVVIHPRGATAVSLRGAATDVDGNAVEQTIVRAYAVAPR